MLMLMMMLVVMMTMTNDDDDPVDVDGGDLIFKDDGTQIGSLTNSSSDFVIQSSVSDKDIIFKGNDGGSTVTSLTLDMSDSGNAIFNAAVKIPSTLDVSGTTTLKGITYTWPGADGSSGQYLKTNGSGTLSWTTVSATTAADDINTGKTITDYLRLNTSVLAVGVVT